MSLLFFAVQLLSEDSIEKDVVSQTQSGLSIASVPDRASLSKCKHYLSDVNNKYKCKNHLTKCI